MNESRVTIIGQITQTFWSATVTYRHEDSIRIISVRRSREYEKERYRHNRADEDADG